MLELHTVHSVAKMDLPDGHQVPGSHQFHCDCEIMKGGGEAELLFGPTVAQAFKAKLVPPAGRQQVGFPDANTEPEVLGQLIEARRTASDDAHGFPGTQGAIGRRTRAAALEECNNPEESHRCGGEEGGNGNACQASDTQPGIVKLNRGLEE